MSFLYNWWYATPQQSAGNNSNNNNGTAAGTTVYNVSARLYLDELKMKLREEFRAECAERCGSSMSGVENAEQNKVIERRRKEVSMLVEKTQNEIDMCTNTSDLLRLEARQKRMREDFLM